METTRWVWETAYKPTANLQRVAYTCGILSDRQLQLTDLTVSELIPRLLSGYTPAVEVTEAFCARAAIAHQLLNCLTDFFLEEAIARAKAIDAEFAQHKAPVGVLHGIPIAIKDTYEVKDKRMTAGIVAWYDRPPQQEDATLVRVMKDAGAIVFARTTMPQTGMAVETVGPLFGRTLSPFNIEFGAGGSSGGDGVLVAMHGAPCAPISTDVGGSIRLPAAFNGLYGMRPTAERCPGMGMASTRMGMISIKSTCGPCAQSMSDLKLATKLVLTHPTVPNEPTCIPGYWHEGAQKSKLKVGIFMTDQVVEPHSPISRALNETARKLRAAGHEVVEFQPPIDSWEAAKTTLGLFFQIGVEEIFDVLSQSGEPPIPQFANVLKTFDVREHSVAEVFQLHREQLAYKSALVKAWDCTARETPLGEPIDCIICPTAPMACLPHDFTPWWGYTMFWNLVDYPALVLPLKDFRIDPTKDTKPEDYCPRETNPFDRPNWEIYDADRWKTQPVTIQIVGRHCKDEDLIAAAEVIDSVVQ
ncbi:NAD(P) transhydrogenase, mitochondrial [Fonsecaea nubica]|uniref:NAD(P) transhydrogenase, mitochondrial n=1 Tax=Fonsecaea nubica TaxID=856822 RepID=A0A178D2B2_9EURO|nr:NAD(P) transhydrogenase, mitochondrial [Fonsecaea nubica]OAL35291.1 NAD(P) transhydrogenase, mitochondrial [Fonsecaea nubica]